jgi:hypothetical protein
VIPDVTSEPGTDGADVSAAHALVDALTETCADRFAAASKASTASVYEVPHVNPVNVYDVPAGLPASVPFRYAPYPLTATLSVDADHESVIAVWVEPLAASPAGVVGADVSEHALVLVVPLARAGSEALPAAS